MFCGELADRQNFFRPAAPHLPDRIARGKVADTRLLYASVLDETGTVWIRGVPKNYAAAAS